MKVKIGFVISEPIRKLMDKIEHELSPYCEIIYISSNDVSETISLYKEYENKVDAFVFSGKIGYYSVLTKIGAPSKPCFSLDENKSDIKDVYLKLLLENRQFDLSRVFVDLASEANDYLGIKELLKEEEWPYFNDLDIQEIDTYSDELIKRHIELYKSGKIDFSITRLGYLLDEFEKNGIPYAYSYPGVGYIINFFMKIINTLNKENEKQQKSGVIILNIEAVEINEKGYSRENSIIRYSEAIKSYAQVNGLDFTIHIKEEGLEILTQYRDLLKLTDGFTNSDLKDYLQTRFEDEIIIGLGTGNNIFQARQNALKARDLSKYNDGQLYHISFDDTVTGPIGKKDSKTYFSKPSDTFMEMAEKIHIDHVNLQKIKAFITVNNSPKITADELADYLGVTVRTANRLLNKIEKYQGAVSYFENIKGGRGRPKKFYDLTFIDEL